jgi:hypothetical protein
MKKHCTINSMFFDLQVKLLAYPSLLCTGTVIWIQYMRVGKTEWWSRIYDRENRTNYWCAFHPTTNPTELLDHRFLNVTATRPSFLKNWNRWTPHTHTFKIITSENFSHSPLYIHIWDDPSPYTWTFTLWLNHFPLKGKEGGLYYYNLFFLQHTIQI